METGLVDRRPIKNKTAIFKTKLGEIYAIYKENPIYYTIHFANSG